MSGPTIPRSQRHRRAVEVTLSPEALDRLDEIARRSGTSRSGAVEALVRAAEMPRTLTQRKDGDR
jgi:metal-responsive CopG/Arc/MetJ family transcriptional regulator